MMVASLISVAVSATAAIPKTLIAANEAMDSVIGSLKKSENSLVSSTGLVLEGAKFGFGMGYITPAVLVAMGNLMITGDILVTGAATAMALASPLAGYSAVIGAIYFGWKSLDEDVRTDFLNKVSEVFKIGVEFVKSALNYAVSLCESIFSPAMLKRLKASMGEFWDDLSKNFSGITNWFSRSFSKTEETKEEEVKEEAKVVKDDV